MDPQEYDGGFFYILDRMEDEKVFFKPKKYSAMVFLGGHLMHGVTQIKQGVREMVMSLKGLCFAFIVNASFLVFS